ncbi:MAG: dipeptide epimerase [Alphaproteobacteria bacterium]|jgi:L-Ala-D/L-Glu epimerase|nr:dipeptide epimerase [Alphaproteobacteria bacterium]
MAVLSTRIETFPLRQHFTISRGTKTETIVVTAEIAADGVRGLGECGPNARYDETPDSVVAQIKSLTADIANGLNREALQGLLPPGAARNALDCALWDFEAKRTGQPAWKIANLDNPKSVQTAFTLSADSPEAMARDAGANADRPLLKLKLTGDEDLARVRAVHDAAPNAQLIVDANEAWDADIYSRTVPHFATLGVALIEQPFPEGQDGGLRQLERPIPVCADESFRDASSVPGLVGKYDVVNIKLDKTGGLTEALKAAATARQSGFEVMVGCMVSTSLAMAPAFLVAQEARFVDLDGPLLLAKDRESPIPIFGSTVMPPRQDLWG